MWYSNPIDIPSNKYKYKNNNNSSSCPEYYDNKVSYKNPPMFFTCVDKRIQYQSLSNSNISDSENTVNSQDKSIQTIISYPVNSSIENNKNGMTDEELEQFLFEFEMDLDNKVIEDETKKNKENKKFNMQEFDGHIDSLPEEVFTDIAMELYMKSQ